MWVSGLSFIRVRTSPQSWTSEDCRGETPDLFRHSVNTVARNNVQCHHYRKHSVFFTFVTSSKDAFTVDILSQSLYELFLFPDQSDHKFGAKREKQIWRTEC